MTGVFGLNSCCSASQWRPYFCSHPGGQRLPACRVQASRCCVFYNTDRMRLLSLHVAALIALTRHTRTRRGGKWLLFTFFFLPADKTRRDGNKPLLSGAIQPGAERFFGCSVSWGSATHTPRWLSREEPGGVEAVWLASGGVVRQVRKLCLFPK